MKVMILEIANWEKYNPRSDVKSSSWFRMDNDFFNDPDFYGTSLITKVVWLTLLSVASKKMTNIIKVNTKQIADSVPCSPEQVEEAIKLISEIRSIGGGPILVMHNHSSKITTIESDRIPQSNFPLRTERTNVTNETNGLTIVEDFAPSTIVEIAKRKKKVTPQSEEAQQACARTWELYDNAYLAKYGVHPVRNQRVNGQIKSFVKRIGAESSPLVAEFYVHHNNAWYSKNAHSVGLMLVDCEKLHTEWLRGKQITSTEARALENKQQIVNVFEKYLDKGKAQ